ncbi:hypothetical protein SLI_4822 [Streptomyces lividans 1326]|uniref:Uncharacterized protein n=1 Tax=Streptomyces lividans 1326 TaxID=1200984 RepID=A0A7U9DUI4_STRLI|nr:hypothetical protein SLI_4822 [Streptomyces lividans 1326]
MPIDSRSLRSSQPKRTLRAVRCLFGGNRRLLGSTAGAA